MAQEDERARGSQERNDTSSELLTELEEEGSSKTNERDEHEGDPLLTFESDHFPRLILLQRPILCSVNDTLQPSYFLGIPLVPNF